VEILIWSRLTDYRDSLERVGRGVIEHLDRRAADDLVGVFLLFYDDTAARREALLARAYPDPSRAPDPVVQEMESLAVNSRAVTKRGLRLVAAGRFAEAEAAFRTVLEIRPGSARDYANLGGALARQSKLDAAITNYRKALEIAPSDPYAHNNLALALAERGDLAGAEQHLETALAAGMASARLTAMMAAATTDRAFADGGHSLDFINKALECLDLIGWDHAGDVVPTAVGHMVQARGSEESDSWRYPVDLVVLYAA